MRKRACKVIDLRSCKYSYLCVSSFNRSSGVSVCFSSGIKMAAECPHCLTWAWRDVTLLVLLRWPQAGLTPVLGLWVTAGPLAAADAPAAVSAALGPGAPGGPAAVHRVARDPTEAKNVSCWEQSEELPCYQSFFSIKSTFSIETLIQFNRRLRSLRKCVCSTWNHCSCF